MLFGRHDHLAPPDRLAACGPRDVCHRPHSDLGQIGEHGLAFILIGLAFGFAHPEQRLRTATVAVVMTGVLEIVQTWMPGRHARLQDFVVDVIATCIGFVIAAGLSQAPARA